MGKIKSPHIQCMHPENDDYETIVMALILSWLKRIVDVESNGFGSIILIIF